jgi:uroporphyrinogen-III decarboxylase
MPIGADLILHEKSDPQVILKEGERLGKVVEEAAQRFQTPLAIPRMDLELEKLALLGFLRVPEEEIPTTHFSEAPGDEVFNTLESNINNPMHPRVNAHIEAIRYIAEKTDLLPIGMSIGPFSLMTKLVSDPITPICLAGMGMTAEDEPEIGIIERVLELSIRIITHTISLQIKAGAKAIMIAEPAANVVYLSPNQIEDGSDIFDRFVTRYDSQIKELLDRNQVDLIFHCCGELTEYFLKKFVELDPAILSLGSSRKLWEDATMIPKNIVLFGNLPSKKFYSDSLVTQEEVAKMACELVQKMKEVDHPFILGSECDVLSVPGCESTIYNKAMALTSCSCCH